MKSKTIVEISIDEGFAEKRCDEALREVIRRAGSGEASGKFETYQGKVRVAFQTYYEDYHPTIIKKSQLPKY